MLCLMRTKGGKEGGGVVLFWKTSSSTDPTGWSRQTPPSRLYAIFSPGKGAVCITESETALSSEIIKDGLMFSR